MPAGHRGRPGRAARTPLSGETSIPALIGGVVMPSAHFYVRNHFHMPMLNRSTWRLQVGGLTDRRLTLSLRDLQAMPSQTQVVTQGAPATTAPDCLRRSTASSGVWAR